MNMGKRYKYFIHDWLVSGLIYVSFCLSMYIVLQMLQLKNLQEMGEQQRRREVYPYDITYQCHLGETAVDVCLQPKLLSIASGNMFVREGYKVGDAGIEAWLHIILKQNEALVQELSEGRMPTERELLRAGKYVLIGCGIKEYTEKKDGERYLKIDGEDYLVLGVLKDNSGNRTDDRVYVWYDSLSESTREQLERSASSVRRVYLKIQYGGQAPSERDKEAVRSWISRMVDGREVEELLPDETEYDMTEAFTEDFQFYLHIAMLVFCSFICIMVSTIWIKRRQRELVIRMALGSSYTRVLGRLLLDLLWILLPACLTDGVIAALQMVVSGEGFLYMEMLSGDFLSIILAGMILIACTVAYPLCRLPFISLAQELKR